MRRHLTLLAFILTAASCGADPAIDSTDQALDHYQNEQVGGCCDTHGGFRVGDPAPVLEFQSGAVLPLMPNANLEHQFSSFEIDSAITSNHADGGLESMEMEIYRVNDIHAYQILVSTRDGDTFSYPVAKIVYPRDTVWVQWTEADGCIRLVNDNASGLGTVSLYSDCIPFQFTHGAHYPDTVYPLSVRASVVSCSADMPASLTGGNLGSFQGWSLYGIGSNGPWEPMTIQVPVAAGCGMYLTDGTWLTTFSWNRNAGI